MARRRRNRLLVPEAREALDAIMQSTANHKNSAANGTNSQQTEVVGKVAESLGIPYAQNGDNGNLTTRQAGRIGGQIGGNMVQKLVAIAEEALAREQSRNGRR